MPANASNRLTLETDRLVLRPLELADQDMITALLGDPDVMRYIRPPFHADEVAALMPQMVKRGAKGAIGSWCVVEKATGARLGEAILLPMPVDQDVTDYSKVTWDRLPDDDVELGYELLPAAWGKGYATEIALRLIRFAFEKTDLSHLVAVIDDPNQASRRVLTKAGFRELGKRRAYGADCPSFRLKRGEWLSA